MAGNLFHKIHLPYIVVNYWDVWDAPVSQGIDPRDVTPKILDLVKSEIIDLMLNLPAHGNTGLIVRR